MEKCIDVSKHQTAFNAVEAKNAGITTVICRLAYGFSEDVKLDDYSYLVLAADLKLGGYGFGTWHYKSVCEGDLDTARSVMRQQVTTWIKIAKKCGCNTWIGIDQELESGKSLGLSIGDNTALLAEAAQMIEDAGLKPCLYASASWIMAHVDMTKFTWPLWVAYYKWYGTAKNFDNVAESFPSNSGTFGTWMNKFKSQICMWQFSSEGYANQYGCTHGSNGLDKNWLYFQPSESVNNSASNDSGSSDSSTGGFDEYCLFPMDVLRVTQGCGFAVDGVPAFTYSHNLTTAYDIAGRDGGKSPVYAPFSCVVKRIYNGSAASSKCNFTWYANTKKVKTLAGKIYEPGMLIFMTAHCDAENMTKYGIKVGATFTQGSICGYEGTAGNVASHCHITFGEGPWNGRGWHAAGSGGNYEIDNAIYMHKTCWLKPDCTVLGTGGYKWTTISEGMLNAKPASDGGSNSVSGGHSDTKSVYFSAYKGQAGSIIAGLKAIGEDSSYDYRAKIAVANGITSYRGSAAQNTTMINLLKKGLLIRPDDEGAASAAKYFPVYGGKSYSIIAGLSAVGANTTFDYREGIASANGITNYRGTADQNTQMLTLLKQGKLIIPQ